MIVLETNRLVLRHLCNDDADFMIELLNDPSFIKNIGNRNIKSREDAQNYISKSAMRVTKRMVSVCFW